MAATKSIASSGNATSNALSRPANMIEGRLVCKAVNSGSPVAGDTVEFYLLPSAGDTDADPETADEFTADDQAPLVAFVDTNLTTTAGDADNHYPIDVSGADKAWKLFAKNNSSTASMTVSARMSYLKSDGTRDTVIFDWT